jgi:Mycothiol maleylpyruvate isomerase N-terminal domain
VTLLYEVHVDAIEQEAERIGELAERGVKVAIRNSLGWDLEGLLSHLAETFGRAVAQLASPDHPVEVFAPSEATRSAVECFEENRLALVAALREHGPADPCWNIVGEDLTVGFLARRLAHESAIHRIDVEVARGTSTTIDSELAADGVDERLFVVLSRHSDVGEIPELGGSICLICSDRDAAWSIDASRGRFRVRAGRGPADAAVVATASDLFCFSWSRPTIRPLQVTGRLAVVEAWHQLPGELTGL